MKKLYILAALLMATTSAHAGGIYPSRSTASAFVLRRRATAARISCIKMHLRPAIPARSAISISRAWATKSERR